MLRNPRSERRPGDVKARAVVTAKIATGEIERVTTDDGKNAAAVLSGAWAAMHELLACLPNVASK